MKIQLLFNIEIATKYISSKILKYQLEWKNVLNVLNSGNLLHTSFLHGRFEYYDLMALHCKVRILLYVKK